MSSPSEGSSQSSGEPVTKFTNVTNDALSLPPRNLENSDLEKADNLSRTFAKDLTFKQSSNILNIVNSKNVHFGDNFNFQITSDARVSSEIKEEVETIEKTEAIEAALSAKCEITQKHMDLVSKLSGGNWRSIFRKLNFEEGEIELMYEDNFHKGIHEVIYQLLLKWIRSDDRTLGELCTVLWNEGKHSLVQKLANVYEQSKLK